ncbi:polysialyltransferase family glycosyltransferase [Moorena sp. SIOASIH]|uniref:polysialyltransferase family glycosyltransferase n=1 Tax=Moorena sp. SIOASIH TaxID=2607817 RepID=UPI0025F8133E|nr:polysialyltransferase family glycosyltransferase [Moorena sp. SIOASIH]
MSNLFAICSVLSFTWAQCLVSSLLPEEENHLWLYTYPLFYQLSQSWKTLLIPELWSSIWYVNFQEKEACIIPKKLLRSPYNYHLTLSKSEGRMREKLDTLDSLSHIYIHSNLGQPVLRFLHQESQRRNCRFIYLEDGLGAYKPPQSVSTVTRTLNTIRWIKQQLYRGPIGIETIIGSIGTCLFLYLTNRQHIYSPYHNLMKFDEAYLMFPEKSPKVKFTGAIIHDLSQFVTPSKINELKQRANLSEYIDWSGQDEGKNSALFLSQSLAEDSLLKMEHQVDLTKRILEQLVRQYQLVFYKPHPRDSQAKTTAILSSVPTVQLFAEKVSLPVEIVLEEGQIQACYGIFSSALVYLPILSGIQTYSFFPWMVRELESMGVNPLVFKRFFECHQAQFEGETIWLEELAYE